MQRLEAGLVGPQRRGESVLGDQEVDEQIDPPGQRRVRRAAAGQQGRAGLGAGVDLVPVCAQLLDAAADAGEIRPDVEAFGLLYGVGNLCAGVNGDPRYDARRMVALLIAGLRQA